MRVIAPLLVAVVGIGSFLAIQRSGDVLNGLSSAATLSPLSLQVAAFGFCLSPIVSILESKSDFQPDEVGETHNFMEEGDINEEDYKKDSIYAFFYSVYLAIGKVPYPAGKDYQFTFNTWGISDVEWMHSETEPQRHGKAAYQGLVEFPEVKKYLASNPNPHIIEIGCGTGAGANFLTELLPGCTYTAFDMQYAAVDTCNQLFAQHNPRLKCEWVPGGVGGSKGGNSSMADASVDIVLISETHIAEATIGPEEIAIFKEIIRVLKPGGFFVWGNALPTSVWHMAEPVLAELGMQPCGSLNHTKNAVQARLEDTDRVNMYIDHLVKWFPATSIPYFGKRCAHVADRLIKNFYRHPGTALFRRMETGADSYMHWCHRRSA